MIAAVAPRMSATSESCRKWKPPASRISTPWRGKTTAANEEESPVDVTPVEQDESETAPSGEVACNASPEKDAESVRKCRQARSSVPAIDPIREDRPQVDIRRVEPPSLRPVFGEPAETAVGAAGRCPACPVSETAPA